MQHTYRCHKASSCLTSLLHSHLNFFSDTVTSFNDITSLFNEIVTFFNDIATFFNDIATFSQFTFVRLWLISLWFLSPTWLLDKNQPYLSHFTPHFNKALKNGIWHTYSAYHVSTTGTTQTCHEWLLKLLQVRSSGQSSMPISTLLLRSPSQLPCLRFSSCTIKVRSLQDTRSTALKGTTCLASPSV